MGRSCTGMHVYPRLLVVCVAVGVLVGGLGVSLPQRVYAAGVVGDGTPVRGGCSTLLLNAPQPRSC